MALTPEQIEDIATDWFSDESAVARAIKLIEQVEAEVRKDALEEAAAVAEQATYRKRWVTAGINGQAGKVPPCAVAAAIRARGKQ